MKDSDKLVEIGNQIKRAREKTGKSQETVAFDVGISVSALSKIECGKSDVKLSTFLKIIRYLNVSPNTILLAEIDDTKALYDDELHNLIKDCSHETISILIEIIKHCILLKKAES